MSNFVVVMFLSICISDPVDEKNATGEYNLQ